MLTLGLVQREFPEAEEHFRGWGQTFVVNCRQPHRLGGKMQMEINAQSGWCHCHNCGWEGSAKVNFNLDPTDEFFADYQPNRNLAQPSQQRRARRGGIMWAPEIVAPGETVFFKDLPDNHVAVQYLAGRGFDIEELRNLPPVMQLYYCTRGQIRIAEGLGTNTGRIVFPIYMSGIDPKNPELKGWQARQIDYVQWETEMDGEKVVWDGNDWRPFKKIRGEWQDKHVAKYYTMPDMKRSECLYNFDVARQYKEVAVVEGPLDTLKVGPQCLGTIGGAVSRTQANLIKTYWETVFYIRDPNVTENDKKFQQLLVNLSGIKVVHLNLAGGKDPGATERASTWKQIAAAAEARGRLASQPGTN